VIVLGHIAGIPVEETLLGFLPVGAVGAGAIVYAVRTRTSRLRQRAERVAAAVRRLTRHRSA
jgi:hypothetical protein